MIDIILVVHLGVKGLGRGLITHRGLEISPGMLPTTGMTKVHSGLVRLGGRIGGQDLISLAHLGLLDQLLPPGLMLRELLVGRICFPDLLKLFLRLSLLLLLGLMEEIVIGQDPSGAFTLPLLLLLMFLL